MCMFQPKNYWINLDENHRYLQNTAVTLLFFINICIMRCVPYLSKCKMILHASWPPPLTISSFLENAYTQCLTLYVIIRWPTFFRCELGKNLVIYWGKHRTFMRVLHKKYKENSFLLQCEAFLCSLVMLHSRLSASNICTLFSLLLAFTEMSDTIRLIHFTCAVHPSRCSSALSTWPAQWCVWEAIRWAMLHSWACSCESWRIRSMLLVSSNGWGATVVTVKPKWSAWSLWYDDAFSCSCRFWRQSRIWKGGTG